MTSSELRRVSFRVSPRAAEEARARMLELFPEGFEESDRLEALEFAAYTGREGEERLREAVGTVASVAVEADWAERWRDFHQPIVAGPFWVGPPWARPPSGAIAIAIDPGPAFGTGAHATTRLCLQLLAEAEPGSLLDVGCGSGVLAIAAAKLGFDPVFALDSDADAVAAAGENAERNSVPLELLRAEALTDPLPAVDVVVANVTLATVESLAPRLSARCLIASGYLTADDPSLSGFRHSGRRTKDGWAADVFERVS